ncbi:hypothetical protein [Aeromicrobium sp. CF3.5]|uniref:hypothetical protein n=1 Tax=Aeromicrobium sp. CF3.5 TaxID=3373078 RepID=UPI003EE48215
MKRLSALVPALTAVLLLSGCSGSDSGPAPAETASSSTEDSAEDWAATWCSIDLGASRAETTAAMGEPSDVYEEDPDAIVVAYIKGAEVFIAFFDADDQAFMLRYELAPDRENPGCEAERTAT